MIAVQLLKIISLQLEDIFAVYIAPMVVPIIIEIS